MTQAETLDRRLLQFPLCEVSTALGRMAYREAGQAAPAVTHVLLHGIGSGSANWLRQLEAAARSDGLGVLAWEAPGYGSSAPVASMSPDASDYAERLWAWLDALGVQRPVTLVGHSLGALMAARAARQQPDRVARMVLLAPAQGYARAPAAARERKPADRRAAVQSLGPSGVAERRGAAMVSSQASPDIIRFVQEAMARIQPAGYAQAARLLAGGNLLGDIEHYTGLLAVASGRADTITPPDACQQVAAAGRVNWTDLGNVGHACPLEAADAINHLLGLHAEDMPA